MKNLIWLVVFSSLQKITCMSCKKVCNHACCKTNKMRMRCWSHNVSKQHQQSRLYFFFQIWVDFYVVISWVQYNACVDLTYSNVNGPSLHHYLRISILGLWLYSYRKEILILANKKCKKIYMYGHLSVKLYLREDTLIV